MKHLRHSTMIALCWLGAAVSTVDARPPNLIVIMTDDMGYADLSCYGNDRYRTPHLDALAKEGLRLTDFHSNAPVCSPTRAALLTGRYQQRSGIDDVVFADPARGHRETHGLDPAEATFASLLQQAGYRTAVLGKWHLGYARRFNPVHHGFDEFRGFVSGNIDFHSHVDQAGFFDWWHDLELTEEPGYVTHLINRHALRFIEENRDRPFCLYLAHLAPHYPYQGPGDPPMRTAGKPRGREQYPPGHVARAYRELVEAVDDGVGELVALLRKLGLDRNTLIVFCSDNGANRNGNNGPLAGFKGSLWEGGHRVPGIAWWPGRIAPGTSDQTALTMDLMPTLLDLAGVEPPEGRKLDGVSLAPLLLEGKPLPERTLFWGFRNQYAVRQGPWKLMVRPAGPARGATAKEPTARASLFHLGDDLGERHDLATQHPDRVEQMLAALAAWKDDVSANRPERQ